MKKRTKRQDLPDDITAREGCLQVVATPIGNLSDLSPRARESLTQADLILAEDTRRTQQLLQAVGITGKSLERCDAHVERAGTERWLGRLGQGARIVLVSDAGTPGVSDPGSHLVANALEQGIRVEPIPGPSAVAALISVAGFSEGASFGFQGFFPRGDRERREWVASLLDPKVREVCRVWVAFESPERILSALEALEANLPEESQVCAAKELTKMHERIFKGTPADVRSRVADELEREGVRGEWLFAVQVPRSPELDRSGDLSEKQQNWREILPLFAGCGLKDSELAKRISKHFDVERREVYEEILGRAGRTDIS